MAAEGTKAVKTHRALNWSWSEVKKSRKVKERAGELCGWEQRAAESPTKRNNSTGKQPRRVSKARVHTPGCTRGKDSDQKRGDTKGKRLRGPW